MTTTQITPVAVVVNDDSVQLTILTGLLHKGGVDAHPFHSAEAALAAMKTVRPPDLIVTDLYMPGIDGWRFCRLLRSPEYGCFNRTPILVVSATFSGDEAIRLTTDLGANAFLPAPVEWRLFLETVKALISGEYSQKQPHVLIVEDSRTLADVLRKVFVAHGYQADTAGTAREAVEAFAAKTYDLAVLDYHLPDGNGGDLLDLFRAQQPKCVVLMMTAEQAPELALDLMKRGAAAYLRKPFAPDYLVELCNRAWRERTLLQVEDLLEERSRELRASEERFRSITQNSFDLIALLDEQGHYLFCNDASVEILGYPPTELVGRSCFELFHPDEREAAQRLFGQCRDAHWSLQRVLFRMVHRDGHEVLVEHQGRLLTDDRGGGQILLNARDVTEQKRAETELRLAHDRLTTAINSMDAVVYVTDFESQEILFANDCCRNLFGNDIVGQKCWQVLQKDMAGPCPFCTNHKLLDPEGKPAGVVTREFQNTRNGRWYECRDTAIRWKNGFWARMEIATDITGRKQWEETLQASEKKYHGLFSLLRLMADTMPDMLWAKNLHREYIFANKALCRQLLNAGDTSEPIGKTDVFFSERERKSHPDQPQWHTFGELCMDSDAVTLKEMRQMQFDEYGNVKGQCMYLDVHKAPLFNAEGELIGVVGSARDITERKRVEAERERLALAIEQAGETIFITDVKGNILYANPAFERATGYTREEVMGRNLRLFNSGAHDKAFYRSLRETLRRGEVWSGRMVNKKKDGTLFTEEAVISPVRDDSGQTVSYVAVKRDVTEALRLEEQLRQAQKMESVGRLAGGVAHDFNNMLGVIIGRVELALEEVEAASPLHADLEDIRKAAMRSADLTRQLLAFARKQTVAPRTVDLNEALTDMLKMLQRLIGEGINLVWQPGYGLWPVKIDPSQIDQILANLCVNARDAIAGSGSITISTGNCTIGEGDRFVHSDHEPGDYVRLRVSDSGCGMDKETLANIFEPFFTTKKVGEGTGLGLATVYGIVRQNNGFVDDDSQPGQGTTFTILLPRHRLATDLPMEDGSGHPPVGGNETILLVEDESLVLAMTKTMLELHGYHVLAAGSPGKAIGLAETYPGHIDLLITDVVMPEMNGSDLAKHLLASRPDLKRLFMSGYTADVVAHHGVLSEGIHFVQKPFVQKDLIAKIRMALEDE